LKYSVAAPLRRHFNLYPRVVDRGLVGFMDLGRKTHGIGWLGDAGVSDQLRWEARKILK
jgi:hypothetical protein